MRAPARRGPVARAPGAQLVVLGCGVALAVGSGCTRLRDREALRRFARAAVAAERQGAKVDALAPTLRGLVAGRDLGELRRFLRGRLLPAHQAWVLAARAMPGEPSQVRAIRAAYVKIAEASLAAHEEFADALRDDTLAPSWRSLLGQRGHMMKARRRFRRAVDRRLRARDLVVRW